MATLAGAVVLFLGGFLIFGLALNSFYMSNQGTATGVNKEAIEWPWMIAATIANAALLTLVLGWAGAKTPAEGFKAAGLVGLLLAIGIDFGMYSMTNIQNMTITLADPPLAAIYFGIGGAVIGVMLGRGEARAT
jgi:hypothetical protein